MELENLTDALDELGIDYFMGGQSLVVKECGECGNNQYKVHIRATEENGLFFGRCYAGSCQKNYSSISLLLLLGMEYVEVLRVHGRDGEAALKKMTPGLFPEAPKLVPLPEKVPEKVVNNDISKFFKLSDWLDHPASVYGLNRGINPAWDFVMIDHKSLAVVFVLYEENQVVGYQKRFVIPNEPWMKTKTSTGFEKEHILVFPNGNKDIAVCEGPFTAVSAWHFGYTGVCTLGAGISNSQVIKISELASKLNVNVGVAFDEDDAGFKGSTRLRSGLFWQGKQTFKISPSVGNDLNDAWVAGGSAIESDRNKQYNPALPDLKKYF